MKKQYTVIVVIILASAFFIQFFLKGLLPIPSDTIVGLYHPFRDLYSIQYPRGIPFKNFLITDPVRQQYPWRNLAISLEKSVQLPLWNPYNFTGSPLLANFQSAVFYPLNIVLFLFPFSIGWSYLIFLQIVLAGIFLYLYLRKVHISHIGSTIGALSFISCGYTIAWMEWNTLLQVSLWLPIILFVKEKLLERIRLKWLIILILAESAQLFAGHLQILFYSFLISNSYLIARILQIAHQTQKKEKILVFAVKKYVPFLLAGICIYAVTIIQWLPTFEFIQLSARDTDQSMWQQAGWFIPWQNLVQFIVPDFFGNPATLNYWGIWNYAEFIGYIGVVPFILAITAGIYRKDKKTLFFSVLLFISILFAFPTGISAIPFIVKIPFLSTSQPTRLLFVIDFSLVILAAFGMDTVRKDIKKIRVPLLIVGLSYVFLWCIVISGSNRVWPVTIEQLAIAKRNLIFPTVVFVSTAILFVIGIFKEKKSEVFVHKVLPLLLLVVMIVDGYRFADKFTPFTQSNYLYPETGSITFLQHNIGNFRYMTTDNRILPPNFSIMYRLQSLDGYDPLYLRSYAELIAASERGKPDIAPPFGFNRIITPHNIASPIVSLLGVKYVLSLKDISSSIFTKVFQEGETRIFENKRVLPRAFFVQHVVFSKNNHDSISMLFDPKYNLQETAVVQVSGASQLEQHFSDGIATINRYSENEVGINTRNTGTGFLILSDSFYPTWHANIDGKEVKILKTDYNLRGILIPAGNHSIRFYDVLW